MAMIPEETPSGSPLEGAGYFKASAGRVVPVAAVAVVAVVDVVAAFLRPDAGNANGSTAPPTRTLQDLVAVARRVPASMTGATPSPVLVAAVAVPEPASA